MRRWRPKTLPGFSRLLALVVCASACEGADAERAQPMGQLDGATIVGGAIGSDGSSPAAPDAAAALDAASAQGARDAGGSPGANAGQAEAGARVDAGPSPRDAAVAASDGGNGAGPNDTGVALEKFSFFVTSLSAMRTLSGSRNGFGGDFRHGETGEGAGLRGADKICAEIAEMSMPGAAAKQWRAFLSTTTVGARTRIGSGPWYDRRGRLIAENLTALMNERPQGAAGEIRDDLPNERGEPNRAGSAEGAANDNHDVVTGSNANGEYDGTSNTCEDWTSTTALLEGDAGALGLRGPRIGHSWPASSGRHWAAAHFVPGCAPSVSLTQGGGGPANGIGNLGGYGALYCFALTP